MNYIHVGLIDLADETCQIESYSLTYLAVHEFPLLSLATIPLIDNTRWPVQEIIIRLFTVCRLYSTLCYQIFVYCRWRVGGTLLSVK